MSGTTDAERAQFVLGVYFRTQAAIERYLGLDGLPAWTDTVATVNAEAARKRVTDHNGQARDLLAGLRTMLDVYGSEATAADEPDRSTLDVRRCGIYDYRERAREQGVQLTLETPCTYCVDLHHRTAAKLDVEVEHELRERGCTWTVHLPEAESHD